MLWTIFVQKSIFYGPQTKTAIEQSNTENAKEIEKKIKSRDKNAFIDEKRLG